MLKSDARFAVYATFKRSLNCIHGHRVKQHKRFKRAALFIFGDVWMRLSSRLMVRKWLRIKMRCNGFLHFHFSVFHFVIEQWVEKDNQIDPDVGVFFRDCFHCSCGWRKLVISKRISEERKLKKNSRPIPRWDIIGGIICWGGTMLWTEDNFDFGQFWKFPFMYTCGINQSFRIFNPTSDEQKADLVFKDLKRRTSKTEEMRKCLKTSKFGHVLVYSSN